jgi:hypothetical protein
MARPFQSPDAPLQRQQPFSQFGGAPTREPRMQMPKDGAQANGAGATDPIALLMQYLGHPALGPMIQQMLSGRSSYGLTGMDPKFFQDPRFDYESFLKMMPNGNPLVLMGNKQRDDYDSAPAGVKSTLAVDKSWQSIAADMEGKSVGPSPWFTQNAKEVMGNSRVATQAMAEEMRRRMLMTRNRIEDRY